jgi:hypothetical protein
MFGKTEDKFLIIQCWGKQAFALLITKQEERMNTNSFLFIKEVSE